MPETEEVDLDELTGQAREDALFGGGPDSEVMKEDPPEEDEEVLEAADESSEDEEDEELEDEEAEEEAERAETIYSRMQAKMQESRQQASAPPVETADSKYASIAEKALDALNAAKQSAPAAEPKEDTTDWTQDPSVVAAYRESYPNLDDEDISRLIRQQKVVSSHEAQEALRRELDPIKKEFESFKQTNAQRQAMGQLQAGFQGTLQSVARKSAVHAYVAQHYNQDATNSLLGAELLQIGSDSPETLMGILRSPKALARVVDGIVFDIESNYGNLDDEDFEDAQVESSTVAQTRSPRRQQKRNKKPSTAEQDEEERRATFGEPREFDKLEFMRPTQHGA